MPIDLPAKIAFVDKEGCQCRYPFHSLEDYDLDSLNTQETRNLLNKVFYVPKEWSLLQCKHDGIVYMKVSKEKGIREQCFLPHPPGTTENGVFETLPPQCYCKH